MNKAFFLDRDGTINVDYNFVHRPREWTWCEGAVEAIRWMNQQGYKVIVVTNQSGITRGRYTLAQVNRLHRWVDQELRTVQVHIDEWFIAPHHPDFDPDPCRFPKEDRKPGTGMFLKAARKHGIDFSRSFMAGDKITDLQPAVQLGIEPVFIRSRHEHNQDPRWLERHNISRFDTLFNAVNTLSAHV